VITYKKTCGQIDISGFQHLYPFNSHYFKRNGLAYHYIDEGAGEPVLMIHGNPTWSFYFRSLIRSLSSRYRVIAPDHFGCGLSSKPETTHYDYSLRSRIDDMEAFIDYLGLRGKITMVAHDWGGIIGLAYAVKYPEKTGRIIIMNTAAFFPPDGKKLPFRLRMIRDIRPFSILAVLGFNLFARGAAFMASHKGLSREVRLGLTAPYNCWKNRIATLKFVQDIPLREKDASYAVVKNVDENLHHLGHVPMLICWGKHDFVFDMSYLAEWQRRFPNAEVHLFSDAGHYVLEDEPEKIQIRITDFLKRNPL
jgi:pimeloyl-ACP methyl ester carboxylesterase